MNITQLECFLTVADTLNFARAAEQLHVTQPAVTQQIHALERELGVQLFLRTTRTVRITQEGLVFLDDARDIVMRARRATLRFHTPDSALIRILSIGCQSNLPLLRIAPALETLARRFPDLHPRLQFIPYQHIFGLLEEGHLDAVLGFHIGKPGKPRAQYRELCKSPLACLVRDGSPLAQRTDVPPALLAEEKLVVFQPVQPQPVSRFPLQELLIDRPPRALYFCETPEAAAALVQAGFGVAVLPELLLPGLPGLRALPVAQSAPVSFGIYYRSLQNNELLKNLLPALYALDWGAR